MVAINPAHGLRVLGLSPWRCLSASSLTHTIVATVTSCDGWPTIPRRFPLLRSLASLNNAHQGDRVVSTA